MSLFQDLKLKRRKTSSSLVTIVGPTPPPEPPLVTDSSMTLVVYKAPEVPVDMNNHERLIPVIHTNGTNTTAPSNTSEQHASDEKQVSSGGPAATQRRSNSSSSASSCSSREAIDSVDQWGCLDLSAKSTRHWSLSSTASTASTTVSLSKVPSLECIMGEIPGQGPGKTMVWTPALKLPSETPASSLPTVPNVGRESVVVRLTSSSSSASSSPPSSLASQEPQQLSPPQTKALT